jgi:glycine/D-amino acid oxidase-like deaminating enzyme
MCTVTARHVVVATEAWRSQLEGHRRSVVPLYSYVIATEPLPDSLWSDIGWSSRETLAEGRNMVTYAQKTADGRIVFGGRGAPYAFGSDIHASRDTNKRVHDAITSTMHDIFPVTRGSRITHRWGGPLGVPRDWQPSVTTDPRTGALHVGGYVGDGVSLSHLAAKIAAHRIAAVDHPVLGLILNERHGRLWEPEPLRWVGINTGLLTTTLADRFERRTGSSSKLLQWLMRLF